MANRWYEIDRPVLEAMYELEQRRIEDRKLRIGEERISEATGISGGELDYSMTKLYDAGLIDGHKTWQGPMLEPSLTPEGLRALDQWPSADGLAEALPEILARLAEELQRQGEGDKAKRLKDVVSDVFAGTASGVIAAGVRAGLGI